MSLYLEDNKIENGSSLSVEMIGENNMALVCKTKKAGCCELPNRFGEWYHFGENNITVIPVKGSGELLYRDRTSGGNVRLNKREKGRVKTGKYCCVVPDSDDNCDIDQTLCINLGMYIIYNSTYNCII